MSLQAVMLHPVGTEYWRALWEESIEAVNVRATDQDPTFYYFNRQYPVSSLVFNAPLAVGDELTIQGRRQIHTLTEGDEIDMPEGYDRAIILNLAMDLAPSYGKPASGEGIAVCASRKSGAHGQGRHSDAEPRAHDGASRRWPVERLRQPRRNVVGRRCLVMRDDPSHPVGAAVRWWPAGRGRRFRIAEPVCGECRVRRSQGPGPNSTGSPGIRTFLGVPAFPVGGETQERADARAGVYALLGIDSPTYGKRIFGISAAFSSSPTDCRRTPDYDTYIRLRQARPSTPCRTATSSTFPTRLLIRFAVPPSCPRTADGS